MDLTSIKGMDHNDRLDALRANADSVERKDVEEVFSQEELAEMKTNLSDFVIDELKKKDELRELSKGLRADIKVQSDNIKLVSRFIADGYRVVNQEVYNIADQELGQMITVNGSGDEICRRKLKPAEKQAKIVNIKIA